MGRIGFDTGLTGDSGDGFVGGGAGLDIGLGGEDLSGGFEAAKTGGLAFGNCGGPWL